VEKLPSHLEVENMLVLDGAMTDMKNISSKVLHIQLRILKKQSYAAFMNMGSRT
jgi:hypothetical protein